LEFGVLADVFGDFLVEGFGGLAVVEGDAGHEGAGEGDVSFSGAVEAGEDGDVVAEGFEGLKDGGDFVVTAGAFDVPVFGVDAVGLEDGEEAEGGTVRACGGGTGGRGGAGGLGHDFELREGEHGAEAAKHGAAGDGLEFGHGFLGWEMD